MDNVGDMSDLTILYFCDFFTSHAQLLYNGPLITYSSFFVSEVDVGSLFLWKRVKRIEQMKGDDMSNVTRKKQENKFSQLQAIDQRTSPKLPADQQAKQRRRDRNLILLQMMHL
jgi:hypothetical protein